MCRPKGRRYLVVVHPILPDFSTEWGLCLAANAPADEKDPPLGIFLTPCVFIDFVTSKAQARCFHEDRGKAEN
jgi:hypothetical protein